MSKVDFVLSLYKAILGHRKKILRLLFRFFLSGNNKLGFTNNSTEVWSVCPHSIVWQLSWVTRVLREELRGMEAWPSSCACFPCTEIYCIWRRLGLVKLIKTLFSFWIFYVFILILQTERKVARKVQIFPVYPLSRFTIYIFSRITLSLSIYLCAFFLNYLK